MNYETIKQHYGNRDPNKNGFTFNFIAGGISGSVSYFKRNVFILSSLKSIITNKISYRRLQPWWRCHLMLWKRINKLNWAKKKYIPVRLKLSKAVFYFHTHCPLLNCIHFSRIFETKGEKHTRNVKEHIQNARGVRPIHRNHSENHQSCPGLRNHDRIVRIWKIIFSRLQQKTISRRRR